MKEERKSKKKFEMNNQEKAQREVKTRNKVKTYWLRLQSETAIVDASARSHTNRHEWSPPI
jgi:hypothetical protein